jgi:IS5 family transposase
MKNAVLCRQLDYLQRNLDSINALIASGPKLSSLTTHWWHKLFLD